MYRYQKTEKQWIKIVRLISGWIGGSAAGSAPGRAPRISGQDRYNKSKSFTNLVLWIRISRIRNFLAWSDPDPTCTVYKFISLKIKWSNCNTSNASDLCYGSTFCFRAHLLLGRMFVTCFFCCLRLIVCAATITCPGKQYLPYLTAEFWWSLIQWECSVLGWPLVWLARFLSPRSNCRWR